MSAICVASRPPTGPARRARSACAAAVALVGATFLGLLPGIGTARADADDRRGTDTRMPGFPDVIGEYIQIPGANAPGTPAVLNTATFLRVRSALDEEHPR